MKNMIVIAIITALTTLGCTGPVGPNVEDDVRGKTAGAFGVQRMATTDSSRGIDIGSLDVRNSRSVMFILKNVGGSPITDIQITTNSPNATSFVVTPNVITEIAPDTQASVLNLIRIDVNHGAVEGLVGQTNIIDSAFSELVVTITGQTVNELDEVVPVSIECDLQTVIYVADFEVEYSTNAGTTWQSAPFDGMRWVGPEFTAGTQVRVRSSGNTPIMVYAPQTFEHDVANAVNQKNYAWTAVAPGESIALAYGEDSTSYFAVDTLGTQISTDDLTFITGTSWVRPINPNTGSLRISAY